VGVYRGVKVITYSLILLIILQVTLAVSVHASYKLDESIEVYLMPNDASKAINRIVELIDGANTYVYVAAYMIESSDIAQALVRAHGRGVDVKIVSDLENVEGSQINYLRSKGIAIHLDNRPEDYMHNKFIVIDDRIVITGSANFNDRSFRSYNNDLVIIHSSGIAKKYREEFLELYNGLFGGGEPTTEHIIDVNGVKVEVYFSPDDRVVNRIVELINSANKSIYFAFFVFTHEDIANALIRATRRGVIVLGVIEEQSIQGISDTRKIYDQLLANDVGVKPDINPDLMHCKLLIIDNKTVVTGSFNPTYHAERKNDENLIIIHNSEIAKHYAEWFLKTIYPGTIHLYIKVVDVSGKPVEDALVTITNIDRDVSISGSTNAEGVWEKLFPTWKPGERVRIFVSYGFPSPSTNTTEMRLRNGLNKIVIIVSPSYQHIVILIAIVVVAITVPIVVKLFKKKQRTT